MAVVVAVAPVDDKVGGSGERVKKPFGHVSTSIEVRAMAMHDSNWTWAMPSMVRMAISSPNGRSPPPKTKPKPRPPPAGGSNAAASMGLGSLAAEAPAPQRLRNHDVSEQSMAVATMPPPLISRLPSSPPRPPRPSLRPPMLSWMSP